MIFHSDLTFTTDELYLNQKSRHLVLKWSHLALYKMEDTTLQPFNRQII